MYEYKGIRDLDNAIKNNKEPQIEALLKSKFSLMVVSILLAIVLRLLVGMG